MLTPPSPWIGSIRTPAAWASTAAARASKSPASTRVNPGVCGPDAALARWVRGAAGLSTDGRGEGVAIPRFALGEPRRVRAEARADGRVAGGGDHRQRAPVKALAERNNLPPRRGLVPAAQARQLHR